MSIDMDRARLAAAEELAAARAQLESLAAQLARTPHWLPSRGLAAQCEEALRLVESMRDRMRRKLVVAIVGPTGAGKSTLLNALSGVDRLSPTGVDRPTTRKVVVFCRDRHDADPLVEAVGRDRVEVVSSPAADRLEHVVLVDTPDINSMILAEHRPIVEAVVGQADVLVCVFNAENPKSREDIDYLAPLVRAFPSRFVLVALNHCDRQDEAELKSEIVPDFEAHLERSWGQRPAGLWCISARANLHQPDWPEGARPRHPFDQYRALAEALYGSLNRASLVVDARIQRARHLVDTVRRVVDARASTHRHTVTEARARLGSLQEAALRGAVATLEASGSDLTIGTDALFYQRLAAVWWGPVGWLIGLWARLLTVGLGIVNVMRFGSPLRQLWGTVSSLARLKQTRQAVEQAEQGLGLESALLEHRVILEREWPAIAESLVSAGFDPSLRDPATVATDPGLLDRTIGDGWNGALGSRIDATTRRLSGWFFQGFLNLWVILPMGVVVFQSIETFIRGRTLSGDYFRHALVTIALLWLLAFVVFQMRARRAGGSRLIGAALAGLMEDVAVRYEAIRENDLAQELETVIGLGRDTAG